jgi:predicted Rossmann-fold nucleotide-binding protein
VREEGLLTVATGGIVYTPGKAGTVQEVFQDFTQNYYGSVGPAAPMVFLGKDFWLNEVPAAPLVQQLARGRDAEQWIVVTDDIEEAVALLRKYEES